MLKRSPYWGWLALCLLLWLVTALHYHANRQEILPERMAEAVNKDIHHQQEALDGFLHEQNTIRHIFTDSLTQGEFGHVAGLPFFVYAYSGDSLKFWNTNKVIGIWNDSAALHPVIVRNEKGIFVEQCLPLMVAGSVRHMVVLFPVLITYPIENEYLRSHFNASDYIPVTTKILAGGQGSPGIYPVTMRGGITAFCLLFAPQDIQRWSPDALLICLLLAALLATATWVQLIVAHITRHRPPVYGFVVILAIILVFRKLLYAHGVPFNLDTLQLFSPQLYASSKYLFSLGDLLVNILCALWAIVYVSRYTGYRTWLQGWRSAPARYGAAAALSAALAGYVFFFVSLIKGLVLDSSISFDVSHFYAINVYTILSLFLITCITGISCMVIYIAGVQLKALLPRKWIKYVLIAAVAAIVILAAGKGHDLLAWLSGGWLLLFIALQDVPRVGLTADLLHPRMIFWAALICLCCTGIIHYFNKVKEEQTRKIFVEQRLLPSRDIQMESAFDKAARGIEADRQVKEFFYDASSAARRAVSQHLDAQYLNGALGKYQVQVYLFSSNEIPLYNKDTASYYTLHNEMTESSVTNTPYLYYKESILARQYYLGYIPIYSDTINNQVGYVILDLVMKKPATETVYPELLQPANNRGNAYSEYAYAIYINDKLITQTNDYPFTLRLKDDTLAGQQSAFYFSNGISELHYKIADNRTVVVVHNHSELIEIITLFSYIFGMEVVVALLALMYQVYQAYYTGTIFSGAFLRLTLRRRIHFSMLSFVLLSFFIIGGITVYYFITQYRDNNSAQLQSAVQLVKQSVQDYLSHENAYDADARFETVSRSLSLKYFITTLAAAQKVDINIYDDKGVLNNTSQDEIFDKGLISRRIRPEAYYQLNVGGKSIVIQNEKVAGLSYLSAYQPLRDEHGITLGYINVPFFSSEKDLNFQISNIVVTLINVYAFIFLLSGLFTILITGWLTRSFNVIIRQLGKVNLQRNEQVVWKYDDEIGTLVKEYNKMVRKVEENAALLAQREREGAWREMARQVAHEIKNPLTPMKLNIQYLQQAMRTGHPNIMELGDRVAQSIVEQIDNLSYIASEFSNFATMPEAHPEEIDLGAMLRKGMELYLNAGDVHMAAPPGNLYVTADRSQLLRVLTNLLENARQAIPAGRTGNIQVSLAQQEGNALVTIKDNGAGIPADVAQRIFQPYFTTKSSGTGLGLAMTRKIIEFWQGEIWFDTVEDEGTTFFIRLPLIVKAV